MDIYRNTETGRIVKGNNLGAFVLQVPWIDCIDRTTGNIKKSEQPYINAWELQQVKTAKIKEINEIRDLIDTKPFVYYANSSTPAYELAVNEFGQVVKTNNNVSFVFDAKPVSIPIRTPSEILNDVKEEYDNGRVDYYLPYSCDIVDQNGAFLRKGGVAIDMKLKEVEKVLYFENFIVIEPGLTGLKKNQLLTEEELIKYQDQYGEESFSAGIGAEAILEILKSISPSNVLHKVKNSIRSLKNI